MFVAGTIFAFYGADVLLTAFLLLMANRQTPSIETQEDSSHRPQLAVIIPAYNEESRLAQCLDSLLANDYSHFKIYIVDDGSTDDTLKLAHKYFERYPFIIEVIEHKSNRGKVAALNSAIAKSSEEIIVTIDADTFAHKSCLSSLVLAMAERNLSAVAGFLKVYSPHNFIEIMQSFEYNVLARSRVLASDFKILMMLPGALHAFKRDWGEKVGLYSPQTLAEDLDLALSILDHGGNIGLEERAEAYTVVPNNLSKFFHQRYRWTLGTIQAYIKHIKTDKVLAQTKYQKYAFPLQLMVYSFDMLIYFIQWPLYIILIFASTQKSQLAWQILASLIIGNIISSMLINLMISQSRPASGKVFFKQLIHQILEKHFSQLVYFPLLCSIIIKQAKSTHVWESWRALKNQS